MTEEMKEEVKKEAEKESDEKKIEEKASDIAEKKIEAANNAKAVTVYENLNKRYKEDPEFRTEFDRVWAGEKEKLAKDGGDDYDDNDLEPIEELRKELKAAKAEMAKTTDEIESLRNVYGYDKMSGKREGTNLRYENDFRKMASEVGYDPGSDAYQSLYADVLREGQTLAKKFGLVDDKGGADPLKSYSSEFLKEAFDNSFDRHKRAGFADGWKRKKELEKHEKKASVKDELSEYFDPKKIKTPEARAAALEKAFKHKFGNNFKIV